ncbi:unnamed protein product [Penicillium pancosmium]
MMPIKPRWSSAGTEIRIMRLHLAISLARPPPCTLPALRLNVPRTNCSPDYLDLLPLVEWEEGGEFDELPPRHVSYTIAWKLIPNRKPVGKVTGEDLYDWSWEDPKAKKHYKLTTPHLERLIDYVDEGCSGIRKQITPKNTRFLSASLRSR